MHMQWFLHEHTFHSHHSIEITVLVGQRKTAIGLVNTKIASYWSIYNWVMASWCGGGVIFPDFQLRLS